MSVPKLYDTSLPWSKEMFKVGDRVTWTPKAILYNIPTKTRRNLCGNVVSVEASDDFSCTYTVEVIWDGYLRAQKYAASFITKVRGQ